MSSGATIGVIGAGAWGTALAQILSDGHDELWLWAREAEVVEQINTMHENREFLPGAPLRSAIRATNDLARLAACDILLLVTPAQHLRATLQALGPTSATLVLCCKGIEAETGMLTGEIAAEICPDNPLAVLSGPTFAHEVVRGLPTALTLACASEAVWEQLKELISKPSFRPYYSDDVIGAEIGGAVKNVLAIGCGVVDGAGLGQNARAALIGRGFAEMHRYGLARGARAETLSGLSGLGDLVLTCSSTSSRNYSLGKGLGAGESPDVLLSNRKTVAEGAATAPVLQKDARERGVDLPIVDAVCALLAGEVDVHEVVKRLMSRPLRPERQ